MAPRLPVRPQERLEEVSEMWQGSVLELRALAMLAMAG
jgi:hypothetical protein